MQSETYPRGEPPRISDFTLGRWIMRSAELQEIGYPLRKEKHRKHQRLFFNVSAFSFIRENN